MTTQLAEKIIQTGFLKGEVYSLCALFSIRDALLTLKAELTKEGFAEFEPLLQETIKYINEKAEY